MLPTAGGSCITVVSLAVVGGVTVVAVIGIAIFMAGIVTVTIGVEPVAWLGAGAVTVEVALTSCTAGQPPEV